MEPPAVPELQTPNLKLQTSNFKLTHMNGLIRCFLMPLLAAAIPLALGGCRLIEEKKAYALAQAQKAEEKKELNASATEKEKPAESAAATKPGDTPPEKKEEPATTPQPEPPALDPAKAEEFKSLPKGEPEFILACRSAGNSDKATVVGRDGLVFSTADLRALGANPVAGSTRHQAIVADIAAYSAKLRAAGIELVVAPVPPKPVVYPDYLITEKKLKDRRSDSYLEKLYDDLETVAVRVVDVTKALRSDRFDKQGGSFPRGGTLWSPRAAEAAAQAIFKSVKRTEAAKSLARDKTIVSKKVGVAQDGEVFAARSVGRLEGDRVVRAPISKEGAPIIVVGDANAAAYGHEVQLASLGDQLSIEFGVPVETRSDAAFEWTGAAGRFSPMQGSPTKIVVWSFSATDFLDVPAASSPEQPASKPARRPSRSRPSPSRRTDPASSLKLRDDPGLDVRSQ
jgi:SGNH hydrolase-like domain, acetyltransferase AlgX